MTASDAFEKVVGEIGFPRREFLYDIKFWEARRIIRGYECRCRDMWSAIRWHAYSILCGMPYQSLDKQGITDPTKLLRFPWEDERKDDNLPTDEEVNETRRTLNELNKKKEG